MNYKLSNRSKSRLEGIDTILIDIVIEAIKDSPYDFGIPQYGGLRTQPDQYSLYQRGASKCDGTIKKSYHQTGKAFDIYAYVDGKATWDEKYYKPIADHIRSVARDKFRVNLIWGGNWTTFVDLPHFQIS